MSKRSVASGTVSFGLVSIPVKFYLAAQAESVSFNMVTPKGNRVRQTLVDAITGEAIDYSQCSKGYEVTKDEFVTFTPDEVKALGDSSDASSIDIKEFIPVSHLDPTCVEKAYHLDAGKGGDKAYRLLVVALQETKRAAVAQWTSRGRQHLLIISAQDDHLVAFQMFYADEVRDFELDCATYSPSAAEVSMACRLVGALTTDGFDSTKYKDGYRERVEQAVEAKRSGTPQAPVSGQKAPVGNDLFAALAASLGEKPGQVSKDVLPSYDDIKKSNKKTKKSAAA